MGKTVAGGKGKCQDLVFMFAGQIVHEGTAHSPHSYDLQHKEAQALIKGTLLNVASLDFSNTLSGKRVLKCTLGW